LQLVSESRETHVQGEGERGGGEQAGRGAAERRGGGQGEGRRPESWEGCLCWLTIVVAVEASRLLDWRAEGRKRKTVPAKQPAQRAGGECKK